MQIVIDVPDRYLLDDTSESLASRLRLLAALMMFRSGQLSAGAATELAGVDRYAFHAACKQYDVPIAGYLAAELEEEVEWLESTDSTSR